MRQVMQYLLRHKESFAFIVAVWKIVKTDKKHKGKRIIKYYVRKQESDIIKPGFDL